MYSVQEDGSSRGGRKVQHAEKTIEVYQLRIWIRKISPQIWRRLLVRSDNTIAQLHEILQIVFGWSDEHLHQFLIRGKPYGRPFQKGGQTVCLIGSRNGMVSHMMSVESYRAEEASRQHLLSSSPKKLSSRQASPDASSSISSSTEKQEVPARVVGASNADIETHEVATSHRPV
jgi:Plasmid pRiA4b ORF-3-like protein